MRQLLASVSLIFALTTFVMAQDAAGERAVTLRQQIAENDEKQATLKSRLQELNEAVKPENIEKSLAGVGSTKPEDLREQKRVQLEAERKGVQTQLDLLATSRTRLETSLARADADAYRESAGVGPTGTVSAPATSSPATPAVKPASTTSTSVRSTKRTRRPRTRPRRTTKTEENHAQRSNMSERLQRDQ